MWDRVKSRLYRKVSRFLFRAKPRRGIVEEIHRDLWSMVERKHRHLISEEVWKALKELGLTKEN